MPHRSDEARRQLLLTAAAAFRDDDPDPGTRDETDALLERAQAGTDPRAFSELEDRFGSALAFGTAGLRGLLGAGPNRMNRRTVARTTAGLCAYLARVVPNARARGLCLGYDGRHGSREFAQELAEIAWGAGFVVHRFADVVPTPVLAFAVLDRAAVGGIAITASHNPAAYNGYKVYLQDGAQLVSPHDRGVQREIDQVGSVLALPRLTREQAELAGLVREIPDVIDRYVAAVAAALGREPVPLPLRAAYTALHGVGGAVATRVFAAIAAHDVHHVPEQAQPDPDFPSVAFPNPEEPGALDRVLALGERIGAAVAIANDPDADRLAIAARNASGALAAFSGNELGILLAEHLLARAPQDGKNLVVSSIVSSPLLERVAAAYGAHCERTLTGFKWIVGRAIQLERERGWRLVLGFEEALGYCIGELVRDKDGIAAAAHALHMAELHQRAGRTLHDALEALYRRHGLCESSQTSFMRPNAEIESGMASLRANPPTLLGGHRVCEVRDLIAGSPSVPASDVLVFTLEGEHRITVRPSGTEPKLKIYFDVWGSIGPSASLAQARRAANALTAKLSAAVTEALGFERS